MLIIACLYFISITHCFFVASAQLTESPRQLMPELTWLNDTYPVFPNTVRALTDPNGLLAAGGNLLTSTLLRAYSRGIFPWYSDGQPILWWSPSPRMTLSPSAAHFGRSLRKLAKKNIFEISVDVQFTEVMSHCADISREGQDGTWITNDIIEAYTALHTAGYAHSIEVWRDDKLVGGLYGVAIGTAFFGESMFSLMSGASKMAFASLVVQLNAWGYTMIDCQMHTEYLASFGASEINRDTFEKNLVIATTSPTQTHTDRLNNIDQSNTHNELLNQRPSTQNSDDQLPPIHIDNWQKHWQLPKHGYDGLNLNEAINNLTRAERYS